MRNQYSVYYFVLLCEAKYFTMRISLSNFHHMHKIIFVWDIPGYMKSKKSRHHYRCLDLSPKGLWFIFEQFIVGLICLSHIFPYSFNSFCIAFSSALTVASAGDSRWQRNTRNPPHLRITITNPNFHTLSFLALALYCR